jgi:hypothetical protein
MSHWTARDADLVDAVLIARRPYRGERILRDPSTEMAALRYALYPHEILICATSSPGAPVREMQRRSPHVTYPTDAECVKRTSHLVLEWKTLNR